MLESATEPRKSGSVTYPLWNYLSDGVPLAVNVKLEGNIWMALIEALDLHGDGTTPREALDALKAHLANYIEFYESVNEAQLTEYAKQQRERFLGIVHRS